MKNFLKGLSFSQLLAGALAAVTSFLLSSKIGIAGSVIGVAVASIVSTSASQIYQNVIDASSKKLQDAAAQQLGEKGEGDADDAADDTRKHGSSRKGGSRKGRVVTSDASAAASHGRPQLTRHDKRVAIVVAVVSGLIAVAVTAGVILALTGGRGTDSVVHDIVSPSMTSEEGGDLSPSPSATVITPSTDATSSPGSSPTQSTDGHSRQDDESGTKDDSGSGSQIVEPSASPSASQETDAADGSQSGASTDSGQDGTGQQDDGRQKDDVGQQAQ
ncbi:hypothetical protein [Bifidobacterium sp. AGR2158]|uniref:hypothetical protein n=1 Tax=Bifidobacterium sp. AGR2158 TaxID=1280675 RepID=UPI0003FBA0F5|nr:hypothetical protein [Bifidobacterium sp. AGR2158]